MPASKVPDLWELSRLRKVAPPSTANNDEWEYEPITTELAVIGNPHKIAYGGCTLALATSAAIASLEGKKFSLYSMLGNYLGPTAADLQQAPVRIRVRNIRQTRSFVTRFITILQQQPKTGEWRSTLSALLDFVVPQARDSEQTLLTYSVQPKFPRGQVEDAIGAQDIQKLGPFEERTMKQYLHVFGPLREYAEVRQVPGSLVGHKLGGIKLDVKTPQDDRVLTDRWSSEWFRSAIDLRKAASRPSDKEREPLTFEALSTIFSIFYLDSALSFIPLTHTGGDKAGEPLWFQHTAACSSLEFAFRFMTDSFDGSQWHSREMSTVVGGHSRTYTESRIFDQHGTLVVTSSQQSILRPSKEGLKLKSAL